MALMQQLDPGPDHQHHRRQAVAPRDPRQDRPGRGPGRRVHRRDQGHRPGDPGHLPDPDVPARQEGRVPALQAVRPARLGPDHLRRGAPAAGAGLPRDGPDPGPAAARPDGDPGPRGRPRGGRLQPDRPEEVRRALARAGVARLDRRGDLHRGPRRPARAAAHGIRRRRVAQQVPHRQREPGQGRRSWPACWSATAAAGC